jgi:MoaA/NifB/PqqE/SkfB family radical SAM enzyme
MTVKQVSEHLAYRNDRLRKVDLNNPKLLGLAAVEINPTELCNRKCSFCPRHDSNLYPNRNLHIDVQTIQNLNRQLIESNYTGDISIIGFGEPLLCKNILEVISTFTPNFYTELVTNGDKIFKGDISIKELEDTNIDHIIVDCYDNADQTEWFVENLKNKKFSYAIRNHYDDKNPDLIEKYGFNNRGGMLYNSATMNKSCYLPSYKTFIDYDGSVRLCCNDWFRKHKSFGNINQSNISDIWMSKGFVEVRKSLLNGEREKHSPCNSCDVDGCKVGLQSAKLWQDYGDENATCR